MRGFHAWAVVGIALISLVWGSSFAAMKVTLQVGLSVGALLTLRFAIGGLCLGVCLLALGIRPKRQELKDGLWMGLVLTAIFWLQADGLRFTTTAKSGFITGLYVMFTPIVSLLMGIRLRPAHAAGAAVAVLGLFLLVRDPSAPMGGWNRGDFETLVCAAACGVHIVMTGLFSRRSNCWVLATTQVGVVALISVSITLFMPAPYGFHNLGSILAQPVVWISILYQGVLATALAFYLMVTLQAHLGATEAAVIYSLEPVFTALLAMSGWIPGVKEHLGPMQLLGGGVLLGAMLLAELGPRLFGSKQPEADWVG